jgi:hypothetical protein
MSAFLISAAAAAAHPDAFSLICNNGVGNHPLYEAWWLILHSPILP